MRGILWAWGWESRRGEGRVGRQGARSQSLECRTRELALHAVDNDWEGFEWRSEMINLHFEKQNEK